MKIDLLNENFKKTTNLYNIFLNNTCYENNLFSEDSVELPFDPIDFPIYFGPHYKHNDNLYDLVLIMKNNFISLNNNIYMSSRFWYSYFFTVMREYLTHKYPDILNSEKAFKNIVIKPFNWESYLYKAILISEYVSDFVSFEEQDDFIYLMIDNGDLFNYVAKSKLFRNGPFFINFLRIIKEDNLSSLLKSKFKNTNNPDKDLRIGRLILQDFSNAYPTILFPLLSIDELRIEFYKSLNKYI